MLDSLCDLLEDSSESDFCVILSKGKTMLWLLDVFFYLVAWTLGSIFSVLFN